MSGYPCPYHNVLPEAVYVVYKNYIVYYNVYCVVCLLKSMCIPSFVLIGCCMSELHAPIVMNYLRLFIVVLQELHCFSNCLHVCMIRVRGFYHVTKFRYSTTSGF